MHGTRHANQLFLPCPLFVGGFIPSSERGSGFGSEVKRFEVDKGVFLSPCLPSDSIHHVQPTLRSLGVGVSTAEWTSRPNAANYSSGPGKFQFSGGELVIPSSGVLIKSDLLLA